MRFETWPALFLLFLIPLFFRFWMRRNRPASLRFPLPVEKNIRKRNPVRSLLLLRCLALACLIVALARPQSSYKQTNRTVSGIDIIMVMDVSASMNIEDLSEASRLDVAKKTMSDFIKGRQNDRIGFVAFSGEPITLAPPTLDYGLLMSVIGSVETGVLKDGTAIGDGLALAVNRLKESKARSRVIILLTDGDNNVGQVDPGTAGDLAAGFGIRVYTIAIGREGRVRMPIKHAGPFGKTITTYQWFENALNPELLEQIAEQTKAKFYRVTDATALESVFSEINQLEKTQIQSKEQVRYKDVYETPLKAGVLLLVFEMLLSLLWWRVVP